MLNKRNKKKISLKRINIIKRNKKIAKIIQKNTSIKILLKMEN